MTNIIHVSLDLETWGKRPGFDLRSIGACVFDPATGFVSVGGEDDPTEGGPFYEACINPIINPDRSDYEMPLREYCLARDPDTVDWWNDQSDEAQAAFLDAIDLRNALVKFGDWLRGLVSDHYYVLNATEKYDDNIRLWSHGAAFDPPILAAAYDACGLPVPWHYRAPRDTRTAFDMAGITDHSAHLAAHPGPLGVSHHALDDAICQARAINAAYARLRDDTYEQCATICEKVTSWGLSPTKLEVAESTQNFCAKAIRAQKSDSPQRAAHEAKQLSDNG